MLKTMGTDLGDHGKGRLERESRGRHPQSLRSEVWVRYCLCPGDTWLRTPVSCRHTWANQKSASSLPHPQVVRTGFPLFWRLVLLCA